MEQPLKPVCLELVPCNKRNDCNESSCATGSRLHLLQLEKVHTATKTQYSQKKNKQINNLKKEGYKTNTQRLLIVCWWECKLVQPLGRVIWLCLIKLRSYTYHLATFLSETQERQNTCQREPNTCIRMFITRLFQRVRHWYQSSWPAFVK